MTSSKATEGRKIGFVGLGKMGRPMALRLIGAGFRVACFDNRRAAVDGLAEAGAIPCRTVSEAARGADILITMLPDGSAVRDVMLGEGAAASAMVEGSLFVDMGSSAPLRTLTLGEELAVLGIGTVDAPVSGGVLRAEDGTLSIMAGGSPDDVDRAEPVLKAMGSRVFRTGCLGSGHAVKALNNYVSAAGLAAACEAAIVAQAFGVDPNTFVDVLNASTGRNNTTEVKMKPHILSGAFASNFALALMAKDLSTAADLSTELGCPQAGMAFQLRLWARASAELGPDADHTEMYRFLKANSDGQDC